MREGREGRGEPKVILSLLSTSAKHWKKLISFQL